MARDEYLVGVELGLEYVSPSGKRFKPHFQVVPYEIDPRTKEFEFIDIAGTFVQQTGMSSGAYALKLYFVGDYHHLYAMDFLAALAEPGTAKLVLPVDTPAYRSVIPISIKQESNYVEGVNRTIFDVKFKETIKPFIPVQETLVEHPGNGLPSGDETYYPPVDVNPARDLSLGEKLQAAIDAKKKAFADKLNGGNPPRSIALAKSLVSAVRSSLNFVGEVTDAIDVLTGEISGAGNAFQSATSSVISRFDAALTSLDGLANAVLVQPLAFATQVQAAISFPRFSQTTTTITRYEAFIDSMKHPPSSYGRGSSDYLQIQSLFGLSAVSALAVKILDGDYQTRQEAVDALKRVRIIYEGYIEYLEDQELATSEQILRERFEVDSEVYESLYELMQQVSVELDRIMSGLRQTVILTTESPTSPMNLVAKHYPRLFVEDCNAALNLFEQTNQLIGDEIFLLPRGREYKVMI